MLKQFRRRHLAHQLARAFLRTYDLPQEELFSALNAVVSYYTENRLVFRLLQFSSARETEKAIAVTVLCQKIGLHPSINDLLHSLLHYRAIDLVPQVSKAIRATFKKQANIHDITVATSHDLSEDQKSALTAALQEAIGGTLVITYTHNPSLIAGIKIFSTNHYWEDSIARRLRAIRSSLYAQE